MSEVGLKPDVSARFQQLLDDVLAHQPGRIHSVYVVGSALTAGL